MVIIVRVTFVNFLFVLGLIFVLPSYAQASTQPISLYKYDALQEDLQQYSVIPHKFIDIIYIIAEPLPTSFNKLQKIFNRKFDFKENSNDLLGYQLEEATTKDGVIVKKVEVQTNNNNLSFYQIKNLITQDGVIIKKVELVTSVKNKDIIQGVYVDLDQNQCVNSKILKKEFSFIIPGFLTLPLKSDTSLSFFAADVKRKFFLIETMKQLGCTKRIGIKNLHGKEEKKEWREYIHK